MCPDFENPFSDQKASFSWRHVTVETGVQLLVYHWQPVSAQPGPALLFVPGFFSIIEGWYDFLGEVIPKHSVYYLESREKHSAIIERTGMVPADFSVRRLSHDIIEVCRQLGLDQGELIVGGSSLGATSLLEAMKNDHFRPRSAFLIGPNTEFKAPWFVRPLLLLHPATYHLVKYFIIWYMRHFKVDTRREPEQMMRYQKTLLEANPYRLKLSALAFLDYQVWPGLDKVTQPVSIAYASSDTLHVEHNIERLASALTQASLLACESNRYMHSARLALDLDAFMTADNVLS